MSTSSTAAVAATACGAGYVIHPHGEPPPRGMSDLIEGLPAAPDEVPFLVTPGVNPLRPAVIDAIRQVLAHPHRFASRKRRVEAIRLVVPHAGAGRVPPASVLASRLQRTVVAPGGALWVMPDRSLLVRGDNDLGVWRSFTPGMPPTARGSRFPSPRWQDDLRAALRNLPAGVSPARDPNPAGDRVLLEEIPAGMWLRAPGSPPVSADDVAFAAPASSDQLAVLVGGPGASRAVTPPAVAELLRGLPGRLRNIAVIVDHQGHLHGDPGPREQFAAAVAALLDAPVRASPGLLLRRSTDGTLAVTTLLGNQAGWRPFAGLVEFRPGQAHPAVVASTPPLPGWPERGSGVWPLIQGWEVEVVEAGLWIRPSPVSGRLDAVSGASTDDPRRVPVDPAAAILTITIPDDAHPDGATPRLAEAAIDLFVSRLPAGVRQVLRRVDRRG